MRMFVALVPPPQALDDLAAFLEPRWEAETEFRWTTPEQWHLTLCFLPSVADRHVDDLCERLGRAAVRRTPLDLRLGGGGCFPSPARAKVLFAGVESNGADEELRRMATGARAAAGKAGTEVKGGRFHPHVTLARLGRPVEATRWLRILDSYRGPGWCTEQLTLIASHLGEGQRRRPRYEVVAAFPIGRAPSQLRDIGGASRRGIGVSHEHDRLT